MGSNETPDDATLKKLERSLRGEPVEIDDDLIRALGDPLDPPKHVLEIKRRLATEGIALDLTMREAVRLLARADQMAAEFGARLDAGED